ncbi:MAG TPA: response regulator transcription factor [Thermotogaceae bacterium]|nr:response regulator transcription factor [Thermotogaceae bacterium]
MPRILVVDDEIPLTEVISAYLINAGYFVDAANDGRSALELFDNREYDLIILDLMLPDIQGEEIIRRIRQRSNVPVIMLTAKTDEDDVVSGLKLGADDYITKPFSMKVLLARVESVLRRSKDDAPKTSILRIGNIEIDFSDGSVYKNKNRVNLTPTEFKLLSFLASNPGKTYSRGELLKEIWGIDSSIKTRVLDVTIKNIRKKIGDTEKPYKYIHTDFGKGYRFEVIH